MVCTYGVFNKMEVNLPAYIGVFRLVPVQTLTQNQQRIQTSFYVSNSGLRFQKPHYCTWHRGKRIWCQARQVLPRAFRKASKIE